MQKLSKLFIFIISFFICLNIVEAKNINIKLGEALPGFRIHLKTPKMEKDKDMFKIYNSDTNELLYCIEPGVMLYDGSYEELSNLDALSLDITEEQMEMVNKIAYFGYQFNDERSDIKWYGITQFVIWEYLLKDTGEVYFIDNENRKITAYEDEIATLKYYVETADIAPSFMSEFERSFKYYDYTDKIVLVDENNVLHKYRININSSGMHANIEGNVLTLTFDRPGDFGMNLLNNSSWIKPVRLYYNSASQTVFGRGTINLPYTDLLIHIDRPNVKIIKKANMETDLSLAGAEFAIYRQSDDYLCYTVTTQENGEILLEGIDLGDYYMVETKAPYGFYPNPEKIYFTVDGNKELEIENEVILKRVDIEKYMEYNNELYNLEPNTEFELYNNKTGKLVEKFKTNELGKYELKLQYGSYTLKQITTPEGYQKIEDLEFTIDENTLDGTNLVLKNKQITGSLTLYKIAHDTQELIFEPAKFKILNKKTQEYLQVNGLTEFATVNGVLTITNIPYGDYEIIEIEAPDKYRLNPEPLEFSIKEMNEVIELNFENTKMTGSLTIKKVDALTNEALANVVFGLYNENMELIAEYITNSEGLINIPELEIGTYYLKELEPPLDYELLTEPILIEIKDNIDSIITVNNRHIIKVPKTGVNELLITIIISAFILGLGLIICNHGKNN